MVAELQAVNESVGQQLVLSRAQLKIANGIHQVYLVGDSISRFPFCCRTIGEQ